MNFRVWGSCCSLWRAQPQSTLKRTHILFPHLSSLTKITMAQWWCGARCQYHGTERLPCTALQDTAKNIMALPCLCEEEKNMEFVYSDALYSTGLLISSSLITVLHCNVLWGFFMRPFKVDCRSSNNLFLSNWAGQDLKGGLTETNWKDKQKQTNTQGLEVA